MPNPERIAGVVVFYNPTEEVIFNISSYIDAIERLLVVDNSEKIAKEIHNSILNKFSNKIEFDILGENRGIAVALNRGIDWATSRGYDWLLTMDQDSSFSDHAFFQEFQKYLSREDVAIFSPNQLPTNKPGASNICIEETIVMTSGNLLNLALHTKIGPFTEKLFIDEVDHDYCLRARKLKYKILKFVNIGLNHRLGEALKKRNLVVAGNQHSPLRTYYIFRNNCYIFVTYFYYFPSFIFFRVMNLLSILKDIILYQKNKMAKLRYAGKGFFHFIIGRYGKL